jgi:hypothetical protein
MHFISMIRFTTDKHIDTKQLSLHKTAPDIRL